MNEFPLQNSGAYKSTEACQADCWLVPSPKLLADKNHPFNGDVVHLYGFYSEDGVYVIESLLRAIKGSYRFRNKIVIGVSKEDFEAQMAAGYWEVLNNEQWVLLNTLSRQAEGAMKAFAEERRQTATMAAQIPTGWFWKQDLLSKTWQLVRKDEPSNLRACLGMYKELEDGTWLCIHLDSTKTKAPKRNFTKRTLPSMLDCRACIAWEISASDPEAKYWPLERP